MWPVPATIVLPCFCFIQIAGTVKCQTQPETRIETQNPTWCILNVKPCVFCRLSDVRSSRSVPGGFLLHRDWRRSEHTDQRALHAEWEVQRLLRVKVLHRCAVAQWPPVWRSWVTPVQGFRSTSANVLHVEPEVQSACPGTKYRCGVVEWPPHPVWGCKLTAVNVLHAE